MRRALFGILSCIGISLAAQTASGEITIVLDPQLKEREAQFAVSAVRKTEDTFLKTFGFDFASNVRVIVSGSPDFLAKQYARHSGGNFSRKRQAFADWITGEAAWRNVYVNVSQRGYNTKADTTLAGNRQRFYNHELFHIMKYELIGSRAKKCCQPNSSREVGPIWMMEGAASYFPRVMEGRGLRNYLRYSRDQVRNLRGKSLATLETRNGMNSIDNSYEIGAYAVSRLVSDHGHASVIKFYQGLRRTANWRKVFEETFNQSVEEFYASFN